MRPSQDLVWQRALALIAWLLLSPDVMADPIAIGVEHCVVNVRSDDVLNMRTKPNSAAPIAARKRHDTCGILVRKDCAGAWCPVEDGHSLGWIHRRYIAMVSPSKYCIAGVAPGDKLNLRAFPSVRSRVVAKLSINQCDIAFLPYAVGSWQKIRVSGQQGWVNRRYLSGQ